MDFVLRLQDEQPEGDVSDVCGHCKQTVSGKEKMSSVISIKCFTIDATDNFSKNSSRDIDN